MDTNKNLPARWLQILATLLGLSLPTTALLLRSNLEGYLTTAKPEWLAQIIVFLLGIIGLVLTLYVFQRPWLKWDEPTGTWVSRLTAFRYCAKCRATKIITPLKNEVTGWRCMNCQHFFHDPARAHIESPKNKATKSERI